MRQMSVIKQFAAATAALLLLAAGSASAAVRTKLVEYKQGDTVLQGMLAWDDAAPGKRPGVLVVPEWWGFSEHMREQAKRFARAGYVAFAMDLYGKGKLATHPKDAAAMAAEVNKDPAVVKARFEAGLAQLKAAPQVDAEKVAAVGYCMGGSIALTMALHGADLDAVSTFHPGLQDLPAPKPGTQVKPRILVNVGTADPMAPADKVEAFKKQLTDAGVPLEVVQYPGAKHGFTNPAAGKAKMPALAYSPQADKQSFAKTLALFKDVFGG